MQAQLKVLNQPCCAPGAPPLPRRDAERLAARFKALADPARVEIVNRLAGANEVCVCRLDIGLSQPTVSHHMRKLLDAGLVEREQRGKWAYFSLKRNAVDTLASIADLKGVCC